jgi:ABC-type dipeptide/oligopeptide/nickel transport system permease subunit
MMEITFKEINKNMKVSIIAKSDFRVIQNILLIQLLSFLWTCRNVATLVRLCVASSSSLADGYVYNAASV